MPAGARRAQILEVAQDLFAREGFHHVSMDDIADAAAVSKPVLYRHFPSKLDLYLAVVDHRGEALVARIDAALAAIPERDTTAPPPPPPIVGAYVEFVEQAGESFSLLFASDVTRDADVRLRVEHASAEAAQAICRGLQGVAGLDDAEARLAAAALVGMAQVAATNRYRTGDVAVERAVELVTDLSWRGVAGLVRDRAAASAADSPAGA